MNRNNKAVMICTIALFLALEIILTRFLSISTPILRLSFGFLPIAMLAIMYGPVWAGVAYALGDLIGAILFPIGPYFPGFTLTAGLSGLAFGLVLYKHPVTFKRSLIASMIVVLCFDLVLNTYWLNVLYGQAFLALLPTRFMKAVLAIPIETILIPLAWKRIFSKIPQSGRY